MMRAIGDYLSSSSYNYNIRSHYPTGEAEAIIFYTRLTSKFLAAKEQLNKIK